MNKIKKIKGVICDKLKFNLLNVLLSRLFLYNSALCFSSMSVNLDACSSAKSSFSSYCANNFLELSKSCAFNTKADRMNSASTSFFIV